jgi:hypothetical protein
MNYPNIRKKIVICEVLEAKIITDCNEVSLSGIPKPLHMKISPICKIVVIVYSARQIKRKKHRDNQELHTLSVHLFSSPKNVLIQEAR